MNELNVKKVSQAHVLAEEVPALLDKENVGFQPIDTVNWEAFPYKPEVQFRIAYTDAAILFLPATAFTITWNAIVPELY